MRQTASVATKLKRLEWVSLGSYLSICHTNSPSASAEALGDSRSTISGRLKKFEELMGIPLFQRLPQKLYVNEQGLCLGKYILPALVLAHFAAQNRADDKEAIAWIEVRLPLRYYGGRISRALEKAIQTCQQQFPQILVWPQPYDSFDARKSQNPGWMPSWPCIGTVEIDWQDSGSAPVPYQHHLDGEWVVLCHDSHRLEGDIALSQLHGRKLALPRMPWALLKQIMALADAHHLCVEQVGLDYRQILNRPNERKKIVLLNSLLLNTQTLSPDWRVHRLANMPHSALQLRSEAQHPAVGTFMAVFAAAFQKDCTASTWHCATQLKQWFYYLQTIETGSISAAAQTQYVSQSAISIQLKQLETTLNCQLLQRRMGVRQLVQTATGHVFTELCLRSILYALFDYVDGQRLNQKQCLSLGVLPSIDSKSTMVRLITHQVNEWQCKHPQVRLEIIEERHRILIDALRSRDLHLAIIEADSPWVSYVPIQAPEPMGLVVHKDKISADIVGLDWQRLADYPLVLPRKGNGMRQIIDQHCLNLGVEITPAMESDSLNINQLWIKQGRYAAILPRSAVARLIEDDVVRFVPLYPVLNRVLRLAYLSNRVLNPLESSLLEYLGNP